MKNILVAAIAFILVLGACKRDLPDLAPTQNPNDPGFKHIANMNDLNVPEGFSWETSRDVIVSVSISDDRFKSLVHEISIYDANPSQGGKLLARGGASLNNSFKAKISTPYTVKSYYIVKKSPDNSSFAEKVELKGNALSMDIGFSKTQVLGKTSAGPDCTTGCTQTLNNAVQNINISSGVLCLTGVFNGDITISGSAVVRICGTATIGVLNFQSTNSQLIVTSTGNLSITTSQPIQIDGVLTNYGTINTVSNMNLNLNSTFNNYGLVNIGKSLNPNGGSISINEGTIVVAEKMLLSSGAKFTNKCKLIIHDDFENNGEFYNYGYIKCFKETTIQGGTNHIFHQFDGAMINTYDMQINGTITGFGATSLIKVCNDTKINTQGVVDGNQQYCDLNGIEINNGLIGNGASIGCSLYIPITSCNPEGNGTPTCPDSDNDGVCNDVDCFPNDPARAFCNATSGYLAYEDLWPYKGDYDMNDIVINYTYNVVTNASNNVVDVNGNYTLRATGGDYNNAFAVQFPVERSKVTAVSGGILESGQTNAVVQIFSNSRAEMLYWNTFPTQPASPNVNYVMSFTLANGPSLSTFGLGVYNPFIWNNTPGFGRGYEVHLTGMMPTDLANSSLFGTGDDATDISLGKTYVTANLLPWAIHIPAQFDYPVEYADINTAYLKFSIWAQSGGTLYPDWYMNLPGYRNPANIY